MNCADQETIEFYVMGKLKGGELSKFEEHLKSCDDCSKKLAQAKENEEKLLEIIKHTKHGSVVSDLLRIPTIEAAQSLLGERYRVSPMVRKKAEAGELGMASGKGYYEYPKKQ